MLCPPGSERDYAFIVVPDSWTFVDRPPAAATASASPLATPFMRQTLSASSTFDSIRAAFAPTRPLPIRHEEGALPAVAAFAAFLVFEHRRLRRPSSSPPPAASPSRPGGVPPVPAPTASLDSPLNSIVASTSDPPARPLRYRMQK
ncbi:hypothetical protein HRG_013716 [Hirsutella rhossiliensis]